MGKKYTTKEFIEKAQLKHGNVFDYSQFTYTNSKTKSTIICKHHGKFEQSPNAHLSGYGCKQCSNKAHGARKTAKAKENFNSAATEVHDGKYTYEKVEYVNSSTKVIITCKEHGDFLQTPNDHLKGQGCSQCAKYGFDKTKAAILYYLKVCGGKAYKIGVTNRTVPERFSSDMKNIEVLKTWEYPLGYEAMAQEDKILYLYRNSMYTGSKLLESGNTELFSIDVLGLDI